MSECIIITLNSSEWYRIKNKKQTVIVRKGAPTNAKYPLKAYVYVKDEKSVVGYLIIDQYENSFPDEKYRDSCCMTVKEQEDYAKGKKISFWNIAKYKTYKKPEELSAFGLQRAPGNWKYISAYKKNNTRKVFKAYTDGSYNRATKVYGYGIVLLDDNGEEHRYRGSGTEYNQYWNVAGEIEAAKMAVKKAKELGCTVLEIYHDYEGVGLWPTGYWRTKNTYTESYASFMNRAGIQIYYHHVKGHSGNKYNEIADDLASSAAGILHTEKNTGDSKYYVIPQCSVEEEAEIRKTTVECIQNLRVFKRKEKHVFKDFTMLKVGGVDFWSKKRLNDMIALCEPKDRSYFETAFGNNGLSLKKQESALRWYHRGLNCKDALRKVETDVEIASNMQNKGEN